MVECGPHKAQRKLDRAPGKGAQAPWFQTSGSLLLCGNREVQPIVNSGTLYQLRDPYWGRTVKWWINRDKKRNRFLPAVLSPVPLA
jgi:hypothetical protein